ncbi:MAG: hypothetical protein U0935_16510 [Pirellulales bacterium]
MSVGIVFLIDESSAMESSAVTTGPGGPPSFGPAKSKAESVATAVNAILAKLSPAGDCEVALVGYRSEADGSVNVGTRWSGALAGREFVSAAEVSASPATVETRTRRVPSAGGMMDEVQVQFPIWYTPVTAGRGPQIAAFDFCRDLLARWSPASGVQGQPLVIHLTAGAAGDGNPLKAVKSVQDLAVGGQNPVVVQLHLSSSATTPPTLFPANRAYLPVGQQREWFERASLLPPHLADALKTSQVVVNANARALVYNAKMVDVTKTLSVVPTHVQKSLAGQAKVAAAPVPTAKPADGGPKLGPAIIKAPPPRPAAPRPTPAPAVKPPTAVTPPAAAKYVTPVKPPVAPPSPVTPPAPAPAPVTPPVVPSAPVAPPTPVVPAPAPTVPDVAPLEIPPIDATPALDLAPASLGDDLLVPTLDDQPAPAVIDQAAGSAAVAAGVSPDSPACIVFVLDRSVEDPFSADLNNACARLQTQLGDMVAELAKGGKGSVDVAVVTYGDSAGDTEVRTTLEGGLTGRTFARDSEVLSGAVRVDEFEDQVSDGVGGLISIPRKRPVLVEVEPTGATAPQPAFTAVATIVRDWCADHPSAGLSPIVIHLTRAAADPGQLQQAAGELTGLATASGSPVALYHIVATEQPHASAIYPNSDADLGTPSLQALWQTASPLLFGDTLAAEKPSIKSGARGLVVNGKFSLLLDPLKRSFAAEL